MYPSDNAGSVNNKKYDHLLKKHSNGIGGRYDYVEDRDVNSSSCSTVICSNDYCIFGIFCSALIVIILYSLGLMTNNRGSHNTTNYTL